MPESIFEGPLVSAGALLNGTAISPMDGPTISYQGDSVPDPRYSPMAKDGTLPGRVPAWYVNPVITLVDAILSANSTASVAAVQTPSTTAAVALTLVTAQQGTAAGVQVVAPGIPIVVLGTTVATTVMGIEFGFTTGTTVANSSSVAVVDNRLFQLGQWISIPGVGASGNTNTVLFTQVQSLSTNTTVMTIFPVAATAGSNLPIGYTNLNSNLYPPATQFGPVAVTPNSIGIRRTAGLGRFADPAGQVARALSITAASIGSGTTAITVTGFDNAGNLMTELLTASGTTTVNGKKAFKYVRSIVVTTAATSGTPADLSVGLSDIVGLPIRSDKWEYLDVRWNGCSAQTNAGWTAALATTSNATTADVRGTVNASTLAVATVASTNGARRLTVIMNVPMTNMLNATPNATASLFGAPQA